MKNLFKINSYFKFLGKHRFYTLVEIVGLSISLMFVILIASYVVNELSVDRFHEKKERIVALGTESWIGSAYQLSKIMKDRYPEIENVTSTASMNNYTVNVDGNRYMSNFLLADTTFFDVFSFRFLEGNASGFKRMTDAIITRSFADRIFPDTDPIGKSIKVHDSLTVTVNGIIADPKQTSFQDFDLILPFQSARWFNWSLLMEDMGNSRDAMIFLLLHEGADLNPKASEISDYFREIFWVYKNGQVEEVTFLPYEELYFSKTHHATLRHGDKQFAVVLISVGVLILIFAIINYINLTVAQGGFRAKEMATRRLLGSTRKELFGRLIVESLLLTMVSTMIGFGLSLLFLPYANQLLNVSFHIRDLFQPISALIVLVSLVLIGIISGLLPAFIISGTRPIDIVKGSFRYKTKMVFSKFFITFQNVITVGLLAISLTMILQIRHLVNAPLGYNRTNILAVGTRRSETAEKLKNFGNEVNQLAGVERISYCAGTPLNRGNNMTVDYEDRTVSFQILKGDSNYMRMLGLELLAEHATSSKPQRYLNEEALRQLDLDLNAVSYSAWPNHTVPLAGVVKDFQLGNITQDQSAMVIEIYESMENRHPWNLLVEIKGDPRETYLQIERLHQDITGLPIEATFMEDQLQNSFAIQQRLSKILVLFTVIALMLSALGLIAISTYFIQQRSKEISIRKIFGSNNPQILKRLIYTFLNYVLIAFFIATPISWFLMKQWLEDYSYRISLNPMIFLTAGIVSLLLALVTVFWQSWKAANSNPIEGLKIE